MPFATSVSLVFITNTLSQRQLLNLLLTFFQYTCILFNLDMRVFHIFLSKECMNIIRVIISYVNDRYADPTVFTFFRIPLCQRKKPSWKECICSLMWLKSVVKFYACARIPFVYSIILVLKFRFPHISPVKTNYIMRNFPLFCHTET